MLSCIALLMDQWKQAYGEILTIAAIAASLLAFTFRLALTQFHQQQEIAQRKAAQLQLTDSHLEVGRLLADARRQTAEITQISELGSLLHACTSPRRSFSPDSGAPAPPLSGRLRLRLAAQRLQEPRRVRRQMGNALRRTRSSRPINVGPCAADASMPIPAEAPTRVARTCSGKVPRSAFLSSPMATPSEPCPSRTTILRIPFPTRRLTPSAFARRRHLAATVAEHIALAIANLGLRESLRLQAVRDPLTGLYNRRYMQEFLDRELHSARRKHRSLAVMMLDLDHFKRYNDNFGHAAGDHALAAVGEMLLRSVRAEDIACRYGGEEFALILPECSLSRRPCAPRKSASASRNIAPRTTVRPTLP